jgi:hypothetical protein
MYFMTLRGALALGWRCFSVLGNEVQILSCPRNGKRDNGSICHCAQAWEGEPVALASPETGLEASSTT